MQYMMSGLLRAFHIILLTHKWRQHEFNKLVGFDRSTMFKPKDKVMGQSPHGLSLAWSYMPHSFEVKVWMDENSHECMGR